MANKQKGKLKILAPVNSVYSAKIMVKAGADEFYVGLDVSELKNITLTSRAKQSLRGVRSLVSPSEFKEIAAIAHDAGKKVYLTANTVSLPVSCDHKQGGDRSSLKQLFLDMVQTGKNHGADAVIVGGMGPLLEIKNADIDIPIHAGTFFNLFNRGQIAFLKNMGVTRVVYPYHMTLEDIQETSVVQGVEYEVFGHYSCGGINGLCYFHHVNEAGFSTGRPCTSKYDLRSSFCAMKSQRFLDTNLDCSICSLHELIRLNIHGIKVVGRELSVGITAPIVKVYRDSIDAYYEGALPEAVRGTIVNKSPYWKEYYCRRTQCKYLAKENLNAMI